ncbi:MAG: cytidylate kinase family protein [Bacillota bacterium]
MIISISGAQGSGKSSFAERLSRELGWPRYYIGGLRREAAARRGMTLEDYNRLGETDPVTDREVDEYQRELGKDGDNFIIEGRTSYFLIPHSLKIYLDVDLDEGAKRIFAHLKQNNSRNEADGLNSEEAVKDSLIRRTASDRLRYEKYYGLDVHDRSNFDYVLDTTNISQEEVFQQVYAFIRSRLDKPQV